MEAVFELIKENFTNLRFNGISMEIYSISLLFLIAEQKRLDGHLRKFVRYGILFFILLASPFVYNDIVMFWFEGAYWKVFMMLLPVVCIAAAIVELVMEEKRVLPRIAFFLSCVLLIAISMDFLFSGEKLSRIENEYKVSNAIMELDDILQNSGQRTVNMIAPWAVCAEIREIDSGVQLLYGEDLIERMVEHTAVSEDELEQIALESWSSIVAVPGALENQIQIAEMYGSNCIVLDMVNDQPSVMKEAGYWCAGRTEEYAVYFR